MANKLSYSDYEDMYPDTVILRKEGVFFNARNNSACVIHAHFDFNGWKSSNGVPTIGFRYEEMQTVQEKLTQLQINYMIIINDEIVDGQSFDSLNQFGKYVNTSIEDLPFQKTKKKEATTVEPLLDERERKLCDISITYMERMLNGIHPVYNTPISMDSVVTDENIKRCFSFISDLLKKIKSFEAAVVEQPNFTQNKKSRKVEPTSIHFKENYRSVIDQMISKYDIKMSDMQTIINEHIADLFDEDVKVTSYKLSNWLLENGYLVRIVDEKGNSHREASKAGLQIGMINKLVENGDLDSYISYRFNQSAQRFVFERLDQICLYKKKKL